MHNDRFILEDKVLGVEPDYMHIFYVTRYRHTIRLVNENTVITDQITQQELVITDSRACLVVSHDVIYCTLNWLKQETIAYHEDFRYHEDLIQ